MQTLALLGGGQLGRMLVVEALRHGVRVLALDPDASSPASQVGATAVCAAFDDASALQTLAHACAAVTIEFENVPAASLSTLAESLPTRPAASAVAVCQDRVLEKQSFAACGLATVPYVELDPAGDLGGVSEDLFPGVLKTSRLGYDGKGQVAVMHAADLPAAWLSLGRVPCILEKRVALRHELSVIVARSDTGGLAVLPVQRNVHVHGILALTEAPARGVAPALQALAIQGTQRLVEHLSYVGVLCCEFFVTDSGELLANEMAPRPHNSGHHSIDSCDVSQFELQLRAALGWPLSEPRQHSPAVMLNLLGDLWFKAPSAAAQEPDWPAVLALPGVHLHLYGKREARPGRKMGHLTVTADSANEAMAVAAQAARRLDMALPALT